jgi:hypothetical protein
MRLSKAILGPRLSRLYYLIGGDRHTAFILALDVFDDILWEITKPSGLCGQAEVG